MDNKSKKNIYPLSGNGLHQPFFHFLPSRLLLVGLRGSGKTSVGKSLSKKLGIGFFDTDEWVEKKSGSNLFELFDKQGEQAFRKIEKEALDEVQKHPTPTVVSTGGGVVLSPKNRKFLVQLGVVAYLHADPMRLFQRIQGSQRPPLTELNPKKEMLLMSQKRHPLYLDVAHVIVDANPPIQQVVEKLAVLWDSFKTKPSQDSFRKNETRNEIVTKSSSTR